MNDQYLKEIASSLSFSNLLRWMQIGVLIGILYALSEIWKAL